MPIQRLFVALCAAEGHQICGANVQHACARAKAPGIKTCVRAEDAHIGWARKVQNQKEVFDESPAFAPGTPIKWQAMDENE